MKDTMILARIAVTSEVIIVSGATYRMGRNTTVDAMLEFRLSVKTRLETHSARGCLDAYFCQAQIHLVMIPCDNLGNISPYRTHQLDNSSQVLPSSQAHLAIPPLAVAQDLKYATRHHPGPPQHSALPLQCIQRCNSVMQHVKRKSTRAPKLTHHGLPPPFLHLLVPSCNTQKCYQTEENDSQ